MIEAHIGGVPSIFRIIFVRTAFELRNETEQLRRNYDLYALFEYKIYRKGQCVYQRDCTHIKSQAIHLMSLATSYRSIKT